MTSWPRESPYRWSALTATSSTAPGVSLPASEGPAAGDVPGGDDAVGGPGESHPAVLADRDVVHAVAGAGEQLDDTPVAGLPGDDPAVLAPGHREPAVGGHRQGVEVSGVQAERVQQLPGLHVEDPGFGVARAGECGGTAPAECQCPGPVVVGGDPARGPGVDECATAAEGTEPAPQAYGVGVAPVAGQGAGGADQFGRLLQPSGRAVRGRLVQQFGRSDSGGGDVPGLVGADVAPGGRWSGGRQVPGAHRPALGGESAVSVRAEHYILGVGGGLQGEAAAARGEVPHP
ncbi:hypothetical protein B1R27_07705 [Streptomyces sp. GKU 895]|nr:hypothetical protein B1R27_07705 [Streptomyces sp. GKU 895]